MAAGVLVGFASGLFGIGGGFLMTPILVFLGVPAPVAVASMAGHVAASSTSGVLAYSASRSVDFRMGGVLAAGGAAGALTGVELFRSLRLAGQADFVVALCYLLLLGLIGALMLWESVKALMRRRRGEAEPPHADRRPVWLYGLPVKMRFPRSRLYISVLPPLALGGVAGVLSAVMGVGGGFLLVPAMIYLLRMPASVVVGTSLFQIILTTSLTTLLQAGRNQTVDIVLPGLLVLGGVVGGQLGARVSSRLRAEALRIILAVLILAIGLSMGASLALTPSDPFVLVPVNS
ncbi:MAG: sulfite exporter TauE/SafE family protein [Phenylobacterium sp.]